MKFFGGYLYKKKEMQSRRLHLFLKNIFCCAIMLQLQG